MRINLLELANSINKEDLQLEIGLLNQKYKFNLTLDLWDKFIEEMTPVNDGQISLFAEREQKNWA